MPRTSAAAWPRSIRGRVTLLALALAALLLAPLGVAVDLVVRDAVAGALLRDTREAAARVAAAYHEGTLRNPVTPGPGGVDVIQIVGPGDHLLAATTAAERLPVLGTARPARPGRFLDFVACPPPAGACLHATAAQIGPPPAGPVVYAAARMPVPLSGRALDALVGLHVAALTALAGWAAWKGADRGLRTVDDVRAQLARIMVGDLSRRVREPPGEDEISTLARTVNRTLARLEHSVEQQRRFAADASHELRTPIAGLRAHLEEARMYPEQADLPTLVNGALRDTDRVEAIVTDLLFLARLGSGGPAAQEPVDLGGLAAEEIARRPGRVPVKAELADGVTVRGVRPHLLRLAGNLLDNAQRHAATMVRVEVFRARSTAVLAVTNDGDRIAARDRERVFQRFTRLDESRSRDRGGTGLGLAIARDVAIAHGGTLHVEDTPEGTRFVLVLPAAGAGP
ncbi:hypothetical protein Sru01_22400 [Sphaerisporangium rufum]|uniref:histidine kinase n=1 Tax=Sphaerisporangium rufum TaxID=1381558 RepID=A0A919R1F9_9ACTN|nr:HAMP domain-containing sensor histidine kinase [Sphaerisporangium rufum]GII77258.1 hypothetical protein Sru01_22400 [Sphaerisporangium rufum]